MKAARICGWAALLASVACALAPTQAALARPPVSIDWRTSPLDLDLRGMNGSRYRFRCPPGKPLESLLTGSGPFTDASSICTAAAQSGVIKATTGGLVTIEIRPGLSGYAGTTRNFIRSNSYATRWEGSFVVIIAPAGPR
ncbi:MAG TPA: LCCL domain-containing protein [Rhizomicrobium sp.]|nr:LCCL domain-containing protein [Rhizomicrobium sp.]